MPVRIAVHEEVLPAPAWPGRVRISQGERLRIQRPARCSATHRSVSSGRIARRTGCRAACPGSSLFRGQVPDRVRRADVPPGVDHPRDRPDGKRMVHRGQSCTPNRWSQRNLPGRWMSTGGSSMSLPVDSWTWRFASGCMAHSDCTAITPLSTVFPAGVQECGRSSSRWGRLLERPFRQRAQAAAVVVHAGRACLPPRVALVAQHPRSQRSEAKAIPPVGQIAGVEIVVWCR